MAIEVVVEPFEYPDTLFDKVKLLALEVTKKNEDLVSAQTSLSKVDDALDEVNRSLDPVLKNIEELEKSLKKSQEG